MDINIYFIIGTALLTWSSVRQYQQERGDFIKFKLKNWIWWIATLGCVLLWPVLLASCIYDVIQIIKNDV